MNRRNETARRRLDERLSGLPRPDVFAPPRKGWVRAIRDALGMTATQLGSRMGIRAQSVYDMENSEALGLVQINTLRKAAAALNCTLVYALIPNKPLDQCARDRARQIAERDLAAVAHSMALEGQGTGKAGRERRIEEYIEEAVRDRDLWNDK
jgi:predicted DNA-binding mobile mystery protein A